MEKGDFYASTGVDLEDVRHDERSYTVEVDGAEACTIQFIGTRRADGKAGKAGEVLEEVKGLKATYTYKGDELYVRAKIANAKRQVAWTQPRILAGSR
jgi:hypothetical protein